jgi:hypothetical protein
VDAVFILMMGIGGYLMWSAYKNPPEGPWQSFLTVLGGGSTSAAQ